MENRIAKSIVNHLPLGTGVIVKTVYEFSPATLSIYPDADEKAFKQAEYKYQEVVGYGNATHTIEIGNKVLLGNWDSHKINVKDNTNDFSTIRELVLNGTIDKKNATRVEVHVYLLTEMSNIKTIIND
jgi:hypothetical protein